MGRRIGDHQRRELVAMLRRLGAQIVDVDVAVRVAGRDHDLHAGHHRARRVGAVRRRGDEDDVAAAIAASVMPRANGEQAGEFALSAGVGLQRHGGKTGDGAERRLELTKDLLVARRLLHRRERMEARELGPGDRQHLRRRVQLHRARAERNHRRVETDVLALEAADVAHHLRFGAMAAEHRVRQKARRPGQRR